MTRYDAIGGMAIGDFWGFTNPEPTQIPVIVRIPARTLTVQPKRELTFKVERKINAL